MLRREMAELFCTPKVQFKELVTVTEVRMSRDLKYATIWVSVFGDGGAKRETVQLLNEDAQRIRYLLAERIRLRRIPELLFQLDDTLERVDRIDSLLKECGIEVLKPSDDFDASHSE